MALCVVVKGQRSLRRNDAPSMMGRGVWSMRPASLTVARVPDAHRVKDMAAPPTNRVGSARSCIPCHRGDQRSSRLRAFRLVFLTRSCGEIGHALSLAVTGYAGNGVIWSPWKLPPFHQPLLHRLRRSHVRSRAHWRMTRQQRLARNRRPPSAPPVEITVYGISTAFAQGLGLRIA